MTKQTVNLLGGLLLVAVLAAGLLLGAAPRWQQAADTRAERDAVTQRNDDQELVIAATRAKVEQLPDLQAQMADLRRQAPADEGLEQVVDLAVSAQTGGAILRSVQPLEPEEGAAASPAAEATERPTSAGFAEVPVSVVLDLRRAADIPRVLDGLREGPRLFAIDGVSVEELGGDEERPYTLTVTGRVFTHPEESP